MGIKEYYTERVVPLHAKFSKYSFTQSKTVVCPLHNDHDPSMGVLEARGRSKERYNCFGCGASGDIIDFHIRVEKVWKGRHLSRSDAAKELGIDEFEATRTVDEYTEVEEQITQGMGRFGVHQYSRVLQNAKRLGVGARRRVLVDATVRVVAGEVM